MGMERWWLLGIFGLLVALHGSAQQVIYANLKELVEDRGDTLSTLKIEKRSKNQILLIGGADYRVSVDLCSCIFILGLISILHNTLQSCE